jgi:IS30 family transposase
MGKKFTQITPEHRIAISSLLRAGISKDKIAKQLGYHRSTIFREIARNKNKQGYIPFFVELKLAKKRKRSFKLNREIKLKNFIFACMQNGWSPNAISGRLKYETNGSWKISPETIYRYIYSDYGIRNKFYKFLRHQRTWRYPRISRHKRSKIPNRVLITERGFNANKRLEIGHWEGDLMCFKKGIKTNLITIRERVSRYMVAVKNPSKHAGPTAEKIIERLKKMSNRLIKSITFDNGSEFSKHEEIAKQLKAKTYFCEPYKSYQKGSIENGNNELRKWFPRDLDTKFIKSKRIQKYIKCLNNRPMKCLGYKTPVEVLFSREIKFVTGNL